MVKIRERRISALFDEVRPTWNTQIPTPSIQNVKDSLEQDESHDNNDNRPQVRKQLQEVQTEESQRRPVFSQEVIRVRPDQIRQSVSII